MTTRLDFDTWFNNNNQRPHGYPRGTPSRDDFKKFMYEMAKQYPHVITKSKSGNGTHVDIGDYHFQATSHWTLYIYRKTDNIDGQDISLSVNYSQIDWIEIDGDMIIINGILALK